MNTVTPEMIKTIKANAKVTEWQRSIGVRWTHETGIHQLELNEEIDLGEDAEPRHSTRRTTLPIEGSISDYGNRDDNYGTLYANNRNRLALLSMVSLLRVDDTITARWVICNDTETMKRDNWHHDTVTLLVHRGNKFIAELAFADQVYQDIEYGGFRGYYVTRQPTYSINT